jgi:hypothetical protein
MVFISAIGETILDHETKPRNQYCEVIAECPWIVAAYLQNYLEL